MAIRENFITVTEFERIALVMLFKGGECFVCPKCSDTCHRSGAPDDYTYDCNRCGRGWVEVPSHIETVAQARDFFDKKETK